MILDDIKIYPHLEMIVKGIEYKNWNIWSEQGGCMSTLRIDVPCICSRSGESIKQGFVSHLPPVYDHMVIKEIEDYILRHIMGFIHDIEKHESKEVFKYNGKMVFDPHDTPFDGKL